MKTGEIGFCDIISNFTDESINGLSPTRLAIIKMKNGVGLQPTK